ncbi:MAG: hypothetical protein ACR2QM_07190 [Longimicrobiales bacterium]
MIGFPAVLIAAAGAGLVAAFSIPAIRRLALARGAVVACRTDRWHTVATPAFGGVGIFLAVAVAMTTAVALASSGTGQFEAFVGAGPMAGRKVAGLVGAGVLMFVAGLVDDLRDLTPATKLTLQVIAASLLISSGLIVALTGVFVLDVLISLAWYVAITNALNLLDNMNGLAGGVSAIAATYLGVLLAWDGLWFHATLAFSLAGACGGFLVHNYPKAKIFMGDSGSLFIGVLLGGLGLSPAPGLSRGLFAVVAVPMLVLAVPILDTMLVTASRLAEGRPISQGGRDHASHRLVAVGIEESRAVRLLWLFAGASGAVALALRTTDRAFAGLLGAVVLLALAAVATYLLGIQVRERVGGGTLLARVLGANRHWPALAIALDVVAIGVAYYGAYLLRWDGEVLNQELAYFADTVALVIAFKVVAFGIFQMYRGPLRYLSVGEGERLVAANVVGAGMAFVASIMIFGFGFSRAVLVVDFLLCLALTLGYRLTVRVLDAQGARWHEDADRAVIVGNEQDALLVLTELKSGGIKALRPVCVLDPAGYEGSDHLRGMTVRSGPARAAKWLSDHGADGAFVVRRDGCVDPPVSDLVEQCLESGIPVHFLDISLALSGAAPSVSVGRPQPGASERFSGVG